MVMDWIFKDELYVLTSIKKELGNVQTELKSQSTNSRAYMYV